jgi:Sortase domain
MIGRAVAAVVAAVAATVLAAPAVVSATRGADAAVAILATSAAATDGSRTGTAPPVATPEPLPDEPMLPALSPASTAPRVSVPTHSAGVAQLARIPVVAPAGVDIEGTDVRGPVVPTSVDVATGELAVPDDPTTVGWYQFGPSPGQPGSAVLAGHLDWHRRPGAFYRLAGISPGTIVTISYTDGSARRFQVVQNQLVPKPSLPLSDVFDRTGPPTLRLITCGGTFDRSTRHYRSNVVVTAVPLA